MESSIHRLPNRILALSFCLLLPNGCSFLTKGRMAGAATMASSEAIRQTLGGKYLVPNVFKEKLKLGEIIDVKNRDFGRIFSADFCLSHELNAHGELPHISSGSATAPEIELLKGMKFDLADAHLAAIFLPEIQLGTSIQQQLTGKINSLSYESFPVGEISLNRKCIERLDARFGDRLVGGQFDGIVMVAEALYSDSTELTLKHRAGSTIGIHVVAKAVKGNPGLSASEVDNEKLIITGKRLLAISAGVLYHHRASASEEAVLLAPMPNRTRDESKSDTPQDAGIAKPTHRIDVRTNFPASTPNDEMGGRSPSWDPAR